MLGQKRKWVDARTLSCPFLSLHRYVQLAVQSRPGLKQFFSSPNPLLARIIARYLVTFPLVPLVRRLRNREGRSRGDLRFLGEFGRRGIGAGGEESAKRRRLHQLRFNHKQLGMLEVRWLCCHIDSTIVWKAKGILIVL